MPSNNSKTPKSNVRCGGNARIAGGLSTSLDRFRWRRLENAQDAKVFRLRLRIDSSLPNCSGSVRFELVQPVKIL
jgi:hypothetical protein